MKRRGFDEDEDDITEDELDSTLFGDEDDEDEDFDELDFEDNELLEDEEYEDD